MKKTKLLFVLSLFAAFNLSAQLPRIAIIGANPKEGLPNVEALANELYAIGLYETVDVWNACCPEGNPSLENIMSYDAVLISGDGSFYDANQLSTNMATYAASGGGVIVAGYSLDNFALFSTRLIGDWVDDGWEIVKPHAMAFLTPNTTPQQLCGDNVGTIYQPDHMLAQNFTNLEHTNYLLAFDSNPPLADGAIRLFDYENGFPAAYTHETLLNRLDLGIYVSKAEACDWFGVMNGLDAFIADCFSYVMGENLGVDENTAIDVVIYPNPALNKINLTSSLELEKVELYSVCGKKIIDQNINASSIELDVSFLAAGSYFLKSISKDGKIDTFKILKK